jgi:PAS domain S-box-containing protein
MDGFYIVDTKGHIVDVNDSYCSLIGYSRNELLNMDVKDVEAEESEELIVQRIQRIMKVGWERFETCHKCKDGRIIDIEASINYSEIGGGKFFVFMRDITERKKAEKLTQVGIRLFEFAAGHSLEELLRKALDEVGILVDSPIGFYHFVEPDQKTLSLQTWSTLTIERFCKAQYRGAHYSIDEAGVWVDCVRQRKPVIHNSYASLPHRKGMPEGHAEVIRELVVPIFRDDRIMAIIGVGNKPLDYTEIDLNIVTYLADLVWEIVERKRMEICLKENEARLLEAQRTAHIGSWEWNVKTNELYWAQENYRIFGLSRDVKPSFEAFLNTIHPDDLKFVQKSLDDALHDKPYDIDMHIIRPDGQERIVNAKGEVHFDEENKPIRMNGTVQDITERKQYEESLKLFRDLIDKSSDAITIVDAETGIILDANEKAIRETNY